MIGQEMFSWTHQQVEVMWPISKVEC